MPDQPAEPGSPWDGPEPREPTDAGPGWPWDGPEPEDPADAGPGWPWDGPEPPDAEAGWLWDGPEPREPAGAEAGWPWEGPEPREPTDAELFGLWPDPFAGPPDDPGVRRDLADGRGVVTTSRSAPHPADLGTADFGSGGLLDLLPPDPWLAFAAAGAYDQGLDAMSDDALIGLLGAARRLCSWQAAVELDVVTELDRRRHAAGSSRAAEHLSAEVAAALTLTSRSADALLCLARDLRRLPAARAGLFTGQIDRAKAAVFAAELANVTGTLAAQIAMGLARAAAGMTTGQLRAELRALILALEPDALRRRAERAKAEARVETWAEGSGNWGIAGRELPAADAITADKRLTTIARALKDAGAEGTLDQLRAAVLAALLNGRDPHTLIPPEPGDANPGDAGPFPLTPGAGSPGCGCPGGGCPGGAAGLGGSVNLTLPLATWLGTTDRPGEIAGLGPVDAQTCRDLAGRLAKGPGAAWCLTLTDPYGRAAAHACATHGPGLPPRHPAPPGDGHRPGPPRGPAPPEYPGPPNNHREPGPPSEPAPPGHPRPPHDHREPGGPGPPGNPGLSDQPEPGQPPGPPASPAPPAQAIPPSVMTWLAALEMQRLERGDCTHQRQGQSYRPSRALRHLIQIRHRTCAHPGCRRPAQHCDIDHTTPYHNGGRTCECNTGPFCRRHHRTKQAPGWHVTQPEPGTFTWTAPHGRSYTTQPDRYPV